MLRHDVLAERRREAGITTDRELAERVGMTPGQVSRILRGAEPGTKFIAGLLTIFGPETFQDFFEVVA